MLNASLQALGVSPDNAVMVGDTTADLGAANAVPMSYVQIGRLHGKSDVEPDFSINLINELLEVLTPS